MQRKRNRSRKQAKTLLYLLRLKFRPSLREPPGVADDEKNLPFRLRIFLFIASKFSSEQVRINAPGDIVEEYKADCVERGKAEAARRLNKEILESILPLVYTFCLVKATRATLSKIKHIPHTIKISSVSAHAFSHLVFFLSSMLLLISTWQRNPLITQVQRTTPISRTSDKEQSPNRGHTDVRSYGELTPTLEGTETSERTPRPNVRERVEVRRPRALTSIILRPYEGTRSEAKIQNGTRILSVNNSSVRFRLILPKGSNEGRYRIYIEDPFGNVRSTAFVESVDGKTLSFTARAESLIEGGCRIAVLDESASGDIESPIYYLIAVKR
jgi:hypothetical protein